MYPSRNFRGKIYQLVDALDFGDAVSNQVIELDGIFKRLGIQSSIYSKWHHEAVRGYWNDIEALDPAEEDILIIHFAGYSEHAVPRALEKYCTRICVYHNITPHVFFPEGSALYDFCLKGRKQLAQIKDRFHYFWGDSDFNLQEILGLGVAPDHCSVVPIVVDSAAGATRDDRDRVPGRWMFLGRIAPNKGQLQLVELFSCIRESNPRLAEELYLVGGYNVDDPYFKSILKSVEERGLSASVHVTGKVADHEVESHLSRASVYVSLSQHEGFGVPLIEAASFGLPVIALNNTAIGETMGNIGTCETIEEVARMVETIQLSPNARNALLAAQRANARRFSRLAVEQAVATALSKVIPSPFRFSKLSIVICTYNRGALLDRCLDYLQYQTNQNFEVIVVNGPSTDLTDEVLEKYGTRIKIAKNPERNLAVSRNIGIEHASGDLIAFIDDDALPFDDWVDTLFREFNARPLTFVGLGGPVYYAGTLRFQAEDIGINAHAEAEVNINSRRIGTDGWWRSLLGTNTCFRTDALLRAGGFDEQFDYFLDESELCFRLQSNNQLIGYCGDLFLRHEFAQSHNRRGKYSYNWKTICKNTAYFIAAYSGLKGKDLSAYVSQRMHDERIVPLLAAKRVGEISEEDFEHYVDQIETGMQLGLHDYENFFPRLRPLSHASAPFKPFCIKPSYPTVLKDIQRLHICIISKEFPPFAANGGIGTLYYHLASELLLMGHYVTLVTPGDASAEYRCGRFTVNYVQRSAVCEGIPDSSGFVNNLNWSVSALKALEAIHLVHRIDIVDSALWDTEALAFSLLPSTQRPPLVVRLVTPFGVAKRLNGWKTPEMEESLYVEAERALISNANAIVPISESIASTIEAEHNIARSTSWVTIPCGIAYWPFFDSQLNYSELGPINGRTIEALQEAKIILFVGRLEQRKGIDVLLQSAAEFLLADKVAHLVLAGRDIEGWEHKSEAILHKSVSGRVHFLGEVNDATRDKLMKSAYCLVFPSRYESFGLVPLESFVHGTPVVAAKTGAIPEVIGDGTSGLLFEPDNPSDLAQRVITLLKEPALRERLAEGAHFRVRELSSRRSAIRTVELYQHLIEETRCSFN